MNNEDKKIVEELKLLKRKMLIITEVNETDSYFMPVEVYNEIMKKIAYLERALEQMRKSRDNWKNKYMELKK